MPRERRLSPEGPDNSDARAIRMAAGREGVLTIGELVDCGLSRSTVSERTSHGWLTRIHEGVYAVGRVELTLRGQFIAAVRACGHAAALSHRSCVVDYGMLEWEECPIDVTVRSEGTRFHDGVRVHRSKLLTRCDLRLRKEIWIVSPEWALLGLASQASLTELTAAVRRGFALKLVSVRSLAAVLGRAGPVRGSRNLASVLAQGYRPTRSVLEDVVLDLIIEAGFEMPEVNRRLVVAGRNLYPDFRWPAQHLIVEADSRTWHDDPISRAQDAERQAILEASGERLIRVAFEQATVGRTQTVERIGQAGAPRPDRSERRLSSNPPDNSDARARA